MRVRMKRARLLFSIVSISIVLMAVAVVFAPGPGARAAHRAFVVGVNRYDNLPSDRQLQKAVNDARAVAAALRKLGFEVTTGENVDRRGFIQLWTKFSGGLAPEDVAAVYFSGHGVELQGANYLLPSDIPPIGEGGETMLRHESVALNELLDELRERRPRVSLLIIDACRNNPFKDRRGRGVGGTRGLERVEPPRGSFVMYSAGVGEEALDRLSEADRDPNSVYTRKLLPLLTTPGLAVTDIARKVRADVNDLAASIKHDQTPAYYDQIIGGYFPAGEGAGAQAPGSGSDGGKSDEIARLQAENTRLRAEREQQTAALPAKPSVESAVRPAVGIWEPSVGPKVGETFRDCADCPEMVVVPAGSFLMGSPADEPERESDEKQHRVTISKPFAVGKYAVTFDEWDACAAAGGCNGYRPSDEGWGRGLRPVINVSWDDVHAYVQWLSRKTRKQYRLPSEAEREYFTRAGTTTPFWWGGTITPGQANYDGTYEYAGGGGKGENRQKTVPVTSFAPNPWGLYQVHGNVWEWVQDCWNETYKEAPKDGSAWMSGDCSRHVLRGGSWYSGPRRLRSAVRYWYWSVIRVNSVGLRLARTF